jgi:hypothetical protein
MQPDENDEIIEIDIFGKIQNLFDAGIAWY